MVDDTPEAQTIKTYDTYATVWANEHSDRSKNNRLVAKLRTYVPKGSILEIGAGGGDDAALLAEYFDYFGTDASVGMVKAARAKYPELHFEQRNVYELARLKRKFDGFWACAVLLHIPKTRIDEALQALNSVIKPGGAGFVSIKKGDKEEFEQRLKLGRQEDRLFAYWQRDDFERVLQRNGFEILDYQYVPMGERTNWHWFFVRKVAVDMHKAGGIIIRDRKVLIVHSKGKEFYIDPGGKLEPGETPQQALVRELEEELGITVHESDVELFGTHYAEAANQPGKRVRIDNFLVKKWQGDITPNNEVDEIRWVSSEIPSDIKLGSIFRTEIIPRLKKMGLID